VVYSNRGSVYPPPSQGGGRGRVERLVRPQRPTLSLPSPWKGEGADQSRSLEGRGGRTTPPPSQGGGRGRVERLVRPQRPTLSLPSPWKGEGADQSLSLEGRGVGKLPSLSLES